MNHIRVFAWAERHLKTLESSIDGFMAQYPYTIVGYPTAVPTEYVVRLFERMVDVPPDPDWQFMIGDILHNFRVALDYLAFAVVIKHNPGANERQIAFPICHDRSNYPSIEGRCLAGAPSKARTYIQSLQPYNGGYPPGRHPLGLLDDLENEHKHRRLLDAGVRLTDIQHVLLEGPGDFTVEESDLVGLPLNHNAEVARITTSDPKTKVQSRARFYIAFDKQGPGRGQIAMFALKEIRNHIGNEIFPLFKDMV